MPSLRGVANHFSYLRSNWIVVVSSFALLLLGALTAQSLVRSGTDAFAAYDSYGSGYGNGYKDNYNANAGYTGYKSAGQGTQPTPCPWYNNSYTCARTTTPQPTPCPWYNNNYACSGNGKGAYYNTEGSKYSNTGAKYQNGYNNTYYPSRQQGNQQQYGSQCQSGNNCYGIVGTGSHGSPCGACGGQYTPTPQPTYTPSPSPTPTPTPTPMPTPAPSTNNNVNNNNSSATANVTILPASTVRTTGYTSGGGKSTAPVGQIMLPETGADDTNAAMGFVGIGGLVAASTAYVASRRELASAIFKRN